MRVLIALLLLIASHSSALGQDQYQRPRDPSGETYSCQDDDALAQCINDVSTEFYECEQSCEAQFPDRGSDFQKCRDECREIHDNSRNSCFELYCPRGNGKE